MAKAAPEMLKTCNEKGEEAIKLGIVEPRDIFWKLDPEKKLKDHEEIEKKKKIRSYSEKKI